MPYSVQPWPVPSGDSATRNRWVMHALGAGCFLRLEEQDWDTPEQARQSPAAQEALTRLEAGACGQATALHGPPPIPVAELLPPESGRVLGWSPERGRWCFVEFLTTHKHRGKDLRNVFVINDGERRYRVPLNVTHWIPEPNQPNRK